VKLVELPWNKKKRRDSLKDKINVLETNSMNINYRQMKRHKWI